MNCPKIRDLVKDCFLQCHNHKSNEYMCAVKAVVCMKKFIINKKFARVFNPPGMEADRDTVDIFPFPSLSRLRNNL